MGIVSTREINRKSNLRVSGEAAVNVIFQRYRHLLEIFFIIVSVYTNMYTKIDRDCNAPTIFVIARV